MNIVFSHQFASLRLGIFNHFFVFMYQSSSTPAEDPLKLEECRLAGKYLLELLKMDLKPRDIITEKSLRNAMVIVMALGGSTNAVLHLIAIARWVIIFLYHVCLFA
jgi:dihydroxyacid dehydratase/phosphogluconate dehydratase